jgi:hypothetical protein
VDETQATPESPLTFVATALAAFAMGVVLISRTPEPGMVSYVALGFLAMNLGLLALKYFNLGGRHNRLLGLVQLRARLADEGSALGGDLDSD